MNCQSTNTLASFNPGLIEPWLSEPKKEGIQYAWYIIPIRILRKSSLDRHPILEIGFEQTWHPFNSQQNPEANYFILTHRPKWSPQDPTDWLLPFMLSYHEMCGPRLCRRRTTAHLTGRAIAVCFRCSHLCGCQVGCWNSEWDWKCRGQHCYNFTLLNH